MAHLWPSSGGSEVPLDYADPAHSLELQLAERLCPPVDVLLANRTFDSIDQLRVLSEYVQNVIIEDSNSPYVALRAVFLPLRMSHVRRRVHVHKR